MPFPRSVVVDRKGQVMADVVVGVDPHKRSNTIEVMGKDGQVLATGRFGTEGGLPVDAGSGPALPGPAVGRGGR